MQVKQLPVKATAFSNLMPKTKKGKASLALTGALVVFGAAAFFLRHAPLAEQLESPKSRIIAVQGDSAAQTKEILNLISSRNSTGILEVLLAKKAGKTGINENGCALLERGLRTYGSVEQKCMALEQELVGDSAMQAAYFLDLMQEIEPNRLAGLINLGYAMLGWPSDSMGENWSIPVSIRIGENSMNFRIGEKGAIAALAAKQICENGTAIEAAAALRKGIEDNDIREILFIKLEQDSKEADLREVMNNLDNPEEVRKSALRGMENARVRTNREMQKQKRDFLEKRYREQRGA